MAWTIEFSATAVKQLKKLQPHDARRVIEFLEHRVAVSDDARSSGKALRGKLGHLWRYRVGNYRIICDIHDGICRILVLSVGHRKDIYQQK